MVTLEQTLWTVQDWVIDRIHYLSEKDIDDARAVQLEFDEWLDPSIYIHDICSLEYIGD
jgi:hypothetical protein